jgi:bacterial/archaeal transporter family-2 protein
MNYLFLLLAFLIGVTNIIQSGVNSQLRISVQSPLLASVISFITGLIGIGLCYLVFDKNPAPTLNTLGQISWWKWTGGVLGAFYVLVVVLVVRDLGSANMVCLIIAGQMLATILIDHYGWVGFPVHSINTWRVVGMALIAGGVYLVLKN